MAGIFKSCFTKKKVFIKKDKLQYLIGSCRLPFPSLYLNCLQRRIRITVNILTGLIKYSMEFNAYMSKINFLYKKYKCLICTPIVP